MIDASENRVLRVPKNFSVYTPVICATKLKKLLNDILLLEEIGNVVS